MGINTNALSHTSHKTKTTTTKQHGDKHERFVAHVAQNQNNNNQTTWAEEEREERDSERVAPSVTGRFSGITSRESPSLPSEGSREEVVSSVSPDSSTMRPEVSSRSSLRTSSETL